MGTWRRADFTVGQSCRTVKSLRASMTQTRPSTAEHSISSSSRPPGARLWPKPRRSACTASTSRRTPRHRPMMTCGHSSHEARRCSGDDGRTMTARGWPQTPGHSNPTDRGRSGRHHPVVEVGGGMRLGRRPSASHVGSPSGTLRSTGRCQGPPRGPLEAAGGRDRCRNRVRYGRLG